MKGGAGDPAPPASSVTLQFARFSDPLSWAIRQYDHGEWSHVDALIPMDCFATAPGGGLLGARNDHIQGIAAGVQIRPPGYVASAERVKAVDIPCTPDQAKAFYRFLQDQIGKPYDQWGIAGFVAGRDWREPDSWFCSELQGAALEHAGIFRWRLAVETNKLTPDGLYLALSAICNVLGT